jgi:alpha-tubulin suppressor-like RCC1 family protein
MAMDTDDAGGRDADIQDARVPSDAASGDAAMDAATQDAALMDAAMDAGPTDSGPALDAALDAGEPLPTTISLVRSHLHTCAVADGRLFCWGDNSDFKLGVGPVSTAPRTTPVEIPMPTSADAGPGEAWAIACAASRHTCAVTTAGRVACWGSGDSGRLGLGPAYDDVGALANAPLFLAGIDDVTHIECQDQFTCALHADRTLSCWGSNGEGQLGNNSDGASKNVPSKVPTLSGVVAMTVGEGHACALLDTQRPWCWGRNSDRQLSITRGPNVDEPFLVFDEDTLAVAAGQTHTCLITAARELRCWGRQYMENGENGQDQGVAADEPTQVNGSSVHTWGALAPSQRPFSCAVTSDNFGYCWGNGEDGQLGNDVLIENDSASSNPGRRYTIQRVLETDATVPSVGSWRTLAPGGYHTCGLKLDNSLWCWGKNEFGQLGVGGDLGLRVATPRRVSLPL